MSELARTKLAVSINSGKGVRGRRYNRLNSGPAGNQRCKIKEEKGFFFVVLDDKNSYQAFFFPGQQSVELFQKGREP